MSIFSSRNVKKAAKSRSKISLPSRVITTNDFGFTMPIFARECIVGDKWNLKIDSFTRLAPLPVPTYASIRQVNRAFYIRFSNVWKPFADFYAQRPYIFEDGTTKLFTQSPIISESLIKYAFITPAYHLSEEVSAETAFDFELTYYKPEKGYISHYQKFTPSGRRLFTLLRNLGYHIQFGDTLYSPFDAGQNKVWSCTVNDRKYSLLPILCYLRLFYDYYVPSRYTNDHPLRKFFDIADWSYTNNQTTSLFQLELLEYITTSFYANYDTDYFTSSWLTPLSPLKDSDIPVKHISDPQFSFLNPVESLEINLNGSKTSAQFDTVEETVGITQTALNLLKSAYDYTIRSGLAGQRYFEKIFAQYGIKLPNIQTRRCEFLGQFTDYIQTQDVTSLSATQGAGLGDYAGKGYSVANGSINCECNEAGYIIVVNNIIPDGGIVNGNNRETLHVDLFDYFQPEFDSVGMQAIRYDELFSDSLDVEDVSSMQQQKLYNTSVFGFNPRYSEYRRPIDVLSGDFVVRHLNAGLDAYHSFRLFDATRPMPLNNLDFRAIDPSTNGNNFSRLFYLTDNTADHFICIFNIVANAERNIKSYKDAFDDVNGGDTLNVDPDCQLH